MELTFPRSLHVRRHAAVEEFAQVAGGFLAAREAENNLPFGIISSLRAAPGIFGEEPAQFATVTSGRTTSKKAAAERLAANMPQWAPLLRTRSRSGSAAVVRSIRPSWLRSSTRSPPWCRPLMPEGRNHLFAQLAHTRTAAEPRRVGAAAPVGSGR